MKKAVHCFARFFNVTDVTLTICFLHRFYFLYRVITKNNFIMKKSLLIILLAVGAFLFGPKANAQTYCTTGLYSNGCQSQDDINSVSIGTYSQLNTGCPSGTVGYSSYISDTIYVEQTASQAISLTSNYSSGEWFAIWIDLNNDSDFSDAGEFIWGATAASTGANVPVTGSFALPTTAALGAHRMRVRVKWSGTAMTAADACTSFSYGEVHDYTVKVLVPPACPSPMAVTLTSVTATTANLSWTSAGTAFNIEYGVAGFTLGAGTQTTSTTTTKAITGLLPNTTYDFYVRNNCTVGGNGLSLWSSKLTFTTPCVAVTVFPYLDNFNGATWVPSTGFGPYPTTIDGCWNRTPVVTSYSQFGWVPATGATSGWQTGPDADKTGTGNYVYAFSDGGSFTDTARLVTPQYNIMSIANPLLTFYIHMYGASTGNLLVQASTNGSTWTTIHTISGQKQTSGTDPWIEEIVDITAYKSTTTQLRFVATKASWGGSDIAIDEISIAQAPLCPKPTAVNISNITSSSATVNFLSSGVSFPIEWGPVGFIQGTGTTVTATATGYVLSGLPSNSSIDIYIQNNCAGAGNGVSAWAGPYNIRTLCNGFAEGYSENFDGTVTNTKQACWYDFSAGGAHDVYAYTPPTWSNITPFSSPNVLYWYNAGSTNSYVVTPELLGLAGDTTQVRFRMTNNYWSGAAVPVYIGTMSDRASAATITWHDTISPAQYTWTEYTIQLNNVPAGHKFVVFGRNNSQTYAEVDIDNFHFEGIPACPPPTSANAQASSATTGIVTWTGTGTAYNIEYGPVGFTQGTGTTQSVTTNTATLSGLFANTCYDVYIQNNCGTSGLGPWYGPVSFCTPCVAVAMPYTQDFSTWPPSCFSFTKTGSWDWVHESTGGHAMAQFWNYSSGTATMVSPAITISQKAQVKFKWAHQYMTFYPDDRVILRAHVMGSPNWDTLADLTGAAFNSPNASTTTPPSLSDFISELIYLDSATYVGTTAQFEFIALTDYGPNAWIDDFKVEAVPSCPEPSQLTTSAIQGFQGTVSWTAAGGSQFAIEYGPLGFGQGSGMTDTVSTTSATLTGLTPVTCYDVYVRALCGANGTSTWAGPISFCTLVSCPVPTNLTLQSAGLSSASMSWTTGSSANWNYVNVLQGQTPGSGTKVNTTSNPLTLTGLVPGTGYSFFVRDSCGPGDVSGWTGPLNYVTPLCDTANQCDFIVNMVDSYGDGWNGFEFSVEVGGVSFYQIGSTFTTGTSATATFKACNGYPVTIKVLNAGSWPTEVSFTIVDTTGATLVTGSSFTSTSGGTTVGTFTPNCLPISCPAPTALTASGITATAANLAWTSTASNFQLSYGVAPFAPASGTKVLKTTTTHALTGLTGNTQYGYYVRAICAPGDTSFWAGPYTFSTACTSYNLPFNENLNGASWVPDNVNFSATTDLINQCWTRTPSIGTSYSWRVRSVPTGSSFTGPSSGYTGTGNYIYTESSNGTSGDQAEIISPIINLGPASNPYLRFYYHFYGAQIGSMYIEGYNGTTWTTVDTITGQFQTIETAPWQSKLVSFAAFAGNANFKFRMRAVSMGCCAGDMALDQFSMYDSTNAACPSPTNFAASGTIMCNQMVATWTPASGSIISGILWDVAGFNPTLGGNLIVNAVSPQTITGMLPGTAYDFYLIDSCSAGMSAPVFLTATTPTGPMPTIAFSANQTSTTSTNAMVTFNAGASTNYTSVSWNFGDGSPNGTNATEVHPYSQNQTYTVTLTLTNGCGSVDSTFTVTVMGIGINETSLSRTLNIFPNPTDGAFTVAFNLESSQEVSIRVLDALGRTVLAKEMGKVNGAQSVGLDLSQNASGIYMVQIVTEEGTITKRLTLRSK